VKSNIAAIRKANTKITAPVDRELSSDVRVDFALCEMDTGRDHGAGSGPDEEQRDVDDSGDEKGVQSFPRRKLRRKGTEMGLTETLTGFLKSSGVPDKYISSVTKMMEDGSLSLEKFKARAQQSGVGDIFDSWVSRGENKPITAEQVKATADPENLQRIANEAEVSVDEAAEELSKAMPEVVDKLSPDGELPADDAVRSELSRP
jgi:uncharacterized protein YidB (DUF937 family)